MKTQFTYNVCGLKIGYNWYSQLCSKEFNERFSKDAKQPFSIYFEKIKDIFINLTNDGDFKTCKLKDCYLDITYQQNNKTVTKSYDLSNSSLFEDFFLL